MPMVFGGPGISPTLRGLPTNFFALPACMADLIPPGAWGIKPGRYCAVQEFDPQTGIWRGIGDDSNAWVYVQSDGVNFRVVNQTGGTVGALITNAGSGYTSAPTVTASTGGSVWQAIVGGAISTTVTVTNGGSNYLYPPLVQISAPGNPGIQATAVATLTSGAVSSITVVDQGAGYTAAPTVTFVNDPRDTTGFNAAATAVLTGAGTITGLVALDHGNPLTSVPTLAFSGGGGSSAAATALMCWTITSYAVTTAGAGLTAGVVVTATNPTFAASAYTNPTTQSNLVRTRPAWITGALSAGGVTATGQVVTDGGIYTGAPTPLVLTNASVVTTSPVVTVATGGVTDVYQILGA